MVRLDVQLRLSGLEVKSWRIPSARRGSPFDNGSVDRCNASNSFGCAIDRNPSEVRQSAFKSLSEVDLLKLSMVCCHSSLGKRGESSAIFEQVLGNDD